MATKYIFITGGVVSSLGKGIVASSLGTLLECNGLRVTMMKLDPYINVDPGTMSPFQHGEVYVTKDGAETDLDLGHYERFTHAVLTQSNNATTGRIYNSVITKERKGDYLGKTVQVVPHITNEIKDHIKRAVTNAGDPDIAIIEVGGTIGDIESLPFLEAIRQYHHEVGRGNSIHIHLTLVPYLKTAGELKTKPTQHSVKELLSIGIQPSIIVCRTETPFFPDTKSKIALFCNVPEEAVIENQDVESIYEMPIRMHNEGLDTVAMKMLGMKAGKPNLDVWEKMVKRIKQPASQVDIGVVGKYTEVRDAYKSIQESLIHGGIANNARVNIHWIDAGQLSGGGIRVVKEMDGIVVPGGFGHRGIEGKIEAIRWARENKLPYFGICLGMQTMAIEFARHLCKLKNANSTEFDQETPFPIISLLEEQKGIKDMGGTMRLGAYPCKLVPGTNAAKAYGEKLVNERHRHRYEFNDEYRKRFEEAGMVFSGTSPDGSLVEICEIKDHPWMVGVQFHPEFQSKPTAAHPLFRDFIKAAVKSKGRPARAPIKTKVKQRLKPRKSS